MSLNYGYIFSQIDKAKKKRWTQADTDKWTKRQEEEKKEKLIKPTTEKLTRVAGRKRGKGTKNLGTEHETRKPEKEEVKQRRQDKKDTKEQEDKDRLTDFEPVTDESSERFNKKIEQSQAQARSGSGKKRGVDTEQTNEAVEAAKKRKQQARSEASLTTYNAYLKDQEARIKRQQKKEQAEKNPKTKKGKKINWDKPKESHIRQLEDPNVEGPEHEDEEGDYSEYEKEGMKQSEKSLWKSWLEKRWKGGKLVTFDTGYDAKGAEEARSNRRNQKKRVKLGEITEKERIADSKKAEEGVGGMNMGAQRGLGHEAGYKQDPGQTAQITEVKEEKEKSAYETSEQGSNESTDIEPNKRQAPASKPGTDTFKSLYKKALIIKYKNIYKPANI